MLFSGDIFDAEGTLVDSVGQNLLSPQQSLADFGVKVPYDLLQLYSGLDGDRPSSSWRRIWTGGSARR
jgi:hypothetical protein